MRSPARRPVQVAVTRVACAAPVLCAALLAGCSAGSADPVPMGTTATSTTASNATAANATTPRAPTPGGTAPVGSTPGGRPPVDPVAVSAGAVLTASGGYVGYVVGTYSCRTTGTTTTVTTSAGATSVMIQAVKGTVTSGAFQVLNLAFTGVPSNGLRGTLTASGHRVTVKGVSIPSRTGGAPVVLDGTVTCH